MDHKVTSDVKSVEMLVKIIREDGTIEDKGTISYWHKNPLKRLVWNIVRLFRGS